jgi:hypothetical protein
VSRSAERQFAEFLAKYTPEIAARTGAIVTAMRARLPGALELVYDNYNALVIGFGPTEKSSEAIFSVVPYPRWVSLFFLQGATLDDPDRLLRGGGSVVRSVVLEDAAALHRPGMRRLIAAALEHAKVPLDPAQPRRMVIKSISAKQRPRRPAASKRRSK